MQLEKHPVSWWNGYDTVFIKSPYVASDDIGELISWINENVHSIYLPIPFAEFAAFSPWRHFPEKRWEMAMNSLDSRYQLEDRSFIDFGGNTGYYTFLARASGFDNVVLVDTDDVLTELAERVNSLYKMGVQIFNKSMDDFLFQHCDIAFCFSALPYVGDVEKCKTLLKYWSERIDILFIEMGDGGSELEGFTEHSDQYDLFLECGWQPTLIGENLASHTNTIRPLWKLEALRLVTRLNPFLPMRNATQSKCYRNGKGLVLKDMTGGNLERVTQELNFQARAFVWLPEQVARPINQVGYSLLMEDLGETEPITDIKKVMASAEWLLACLKKAKIIHGDLDKPNLIIQDNVVKVLDFGWSQEANSGSNNLDRKRLMKALHDIAS